MHAAGGPHKAEIIQRGVQLGVDWLKDALVHDPDPQGGLWNV